MKEGKGPFSQGTFAPPLPELEMEDVHGSRLDSGQGNLLYFVIEVTFVS